MPTARPRSRGVITGAALAILLCATARHAVAGSEVALGGGIGFRLFDERESYSFTPWLALRHGLAGPWSALARVGYERHAVPATYRVCLGPGCPTSAVGEDRVTYLPASLGIRVSSAGRPPARIGAFLDIAPSITWTRFENEARLGYPDGRTLRDVRSSTHWLVGAELGAGFEHTLRGALGFEWGLRYAYLGAPRETEATRSLGLGRDGIQRWSLVAALTLAP